MRSTWLLAWPCIH